jgi:hypothetical protein
MQVKSPELNPSLTYIIPISEKIHLGKFRILQDKTLNKLGMQGKYLNIKRSFLISQQVAPYWVEES